MTVDERYFSDDEIEFHIGISQSKLRTAQRFGLIESAATLERGRYIRIWSTCDAVKVNVADMLSSSLGISFQAACCLLPDFFRTYPETENFREFAKLNTPVDPFDLNLFWTRNPVVGLVNRKVVYSVHHTVTKVLGRMGDDAHGRMTFHYDPDTTLPALQDSVSWSAFNPVHAIEVSLKKVDEVH